MRPERKQKAKDGELRDAIKTQGSWFGAVVFLHGYLLQYPSFLSVSDNSLE